ncbi:DinB family protein [Paenibacillus alvei]|uniref:DinB family protein n=1 Tax=Paenibacillus alvei TaxID=44250 RepID=A0AAP6ZZQ2_PAEAL|nr:DinB family protein [Paenibacillus alvei]NOJ71744.1 DinB family protein [Paenibacillus alvei]
MLTQPLSTEYGEAFANYIGQVEYRYAPGKWSIKEVLGHIANTERVMAYRLLRIARGDQTPLTGFDENQFMNGFAFDSMPMSELLEDYQAVRHATLTLLRGLTDEAALRTGTTNNMTISARALAYTIAGHELHHLRVLKMRWLTSFQTSPEQFEQLTALRSENVIIVS